MLGKSKVSTDAERLSQSGHWVAVCSSCIRGRTACRALFREDNFIETCGRLATTQACGNTSPRSLCGWYSSPCLHGDGTKTVPPRDGTHSSAESRWKLVVFKTVSSVIFPSQRGGVQSCKLRLHRTLIWLGPVVRRYPAYLDIVSYTPCRLVAKSIFFGTMATNLLAMASNPVQGV